MSTSHDNHSIAAEVPIVLPQTSDAPDSPVPTTSTTQDSETPRRYEATRVPDAENKVKIRPELPPKPEGTRFHTLDIVRGMACLMLMFYHATFYAEHSWSTGDSSTWTVGGLAINLVGRLWVGVPMFFVVSGYCIAASIDSLRRKPHSLWNYFYRRFRRIYPPLWAGFVFAMIFTAIVSLNSSLLNNCLQLPRMASFTGVDLDCKFYCHGVLVA